jgi:hypothetical protein
MIAGRFFIFDDKASTQTVSIFGYNCFKKSENNDLPLGEQYPVCVALDDKHLEFFINYDNKGKNNNHELFSFPLLNDPSSDKAIMNTLEKISRQSYFDKKEANLSFYTEGSPFYKLWFKKNLKNGQEEGKLYKDALLLDFLFDFAHSDVFKSNPYWQLLNARIQTNPFLKAILCKGEWLFWQDKYLKNKEDNGSTDSQNHISEKRFEADEEWVEIITSDASPKLFVESGEWFESAGEEMKQLLYEDHDSEQKSEWQWFVSVFYDTQQIKEGKQFVEFLTLTSKFIVLILTANVVNWLSSQYVPTRLVWAQQIDYLIIQSWLIGRVAWIYELLYLNRKNTDLPERQIWLDKHFKLQVKENNKQDVFDTIRLSRSRIYHFFFNRFDFDDGYKWFLRQSGKKSRLFLNYLIFFVVINLVLFVRFKPSIKLWELVKDASSLLFLPLLGFLLPIPSTFFKDWGGRKTLLTNWTLFFSTLIFGIFIFINRSYLNYDWKRLSVILIFVVLVIVIFMPMTFIFEMQFKPNKNKYPSIFHPGLTLPKTSLAMLTGWLVWVPFAEEAWKLNANVEPVRILLWLLLMLLLAFICIFFTMKGIQTELVVGNGLTGGAIGVVLAGYAFAFGWGVLTTQFTCRQALDEPEMLMPYVFEKTENIKEFKLSRDTLLAKAIKFNKQNDSLKTIQNWKVSTDSLIIKEIIKANVIDSFLTNKKVDGEKLVLYLDSKQRVLTDSLIDAHAASERKLPAVVRWKIWLPQCVLNWLNDGDAIYIYTFPRMLLINSGIAFFLGFFAQIAFQSAGYKEPI